MNFELIITALLKEKVHYQDSIELIGRYINETMFHNEKLKDLHRRTGYKYYVFSNFYPFEKDKMYKKGAVYIVRLKSMDKKFLRELQGCFPKVNNSFMQVLSSELRTLPVKHIAELYTVTPVVITVDNKPFLPEDDLDILLERLQANLEKKYTSFYGQGDFNESFIQRIELLNSKPIATKYKNVRLLGNKLKIAVKEDEKSQLLAHVALGCGLGEKNSALGCGFCFANYL
ncbi:CRISPR-associated endoribonuclease Cas6 [Bacillus sp. C1]